MAEKSKLETLYEIYKLAKAICARVDHPIVIISNGQTQHRSASKEPTEDVW